LDAPQKTAGPGTSGEFVAPVTPVTGAFDQVSEFKIQFAVNNAFHWLSGLLQVKLL
jgi:hypothetical protein